MAACLAAAVAVAAWGLYALARNALGRGRGGPLFPVLVGGKVGYIDRGGELVIPATFGALKTPDAITSATPPPYYSSTREWFRWAHDFRDGRCLVLAGGKQRLIDASGRFIGSGEPGQAEAAFLAAVQGQEQPGRTVEFCRGAARNGPAGSVIPISGLDAAARPQLRAVPFGGKWGIAGPDGGWRTPPVLDSGFCGRPGLQYSEGRAPIASGRKVGYVDAEGRLAIQPQFDFAQPFSNGLARVAIYERRSPNALSRWLGRIKVFRWLATSSLVVRWGYVDRAGKWVWEPTR